MCQGNSIKTAFIIWCIGITALLIVQISVFWSSYQIYSGASAISTTAFSNISSNSGYLLQKEQALERNLKLLWLTTSLLLLLVFALIYFVVVRIGHPFKTLAHALDCFANGNQVNRLEYTRQDESP